MANIIINNYCNQKCDYCFAWKNMEDPSLKNEMGMMTFLYCLKHLKNIGDNRVRILGGEPLLHTKVVDIFKISVKAGFVMTTFSNFKIPLSKWEKILNFGEDYDYSRLKFNLNLNDESFYQKKELELIHNSLNFLQKRGCDIVVSYNVYEYSHGYDFIFETARKYGASSVVLKVTNTIIGDEEIIDTNDKKYGDYLYKITKKYASSIPIAFSCGLARSIFTEEQRDFLTNEVGIELLYGCEANGGKYDINTDGTVYRCFPLQNLYNSSLFHISQKIFQKNTKGQIRNFLDSFVPRQKGLIDNGNCLGNQMNKIEKNIPTIVGTNYIMTNHDYSMVIIDNGTIQAINIERIDRLKKSPCAFETKFLKAAKTNPYYALPIEYFSKTLSQREYIILNDPHHPENHILQHHFLHSCSAFYASNFEEAAILCVDGHGADIINDVFINVTQSIWSSDNGRIKEIHKTCEGGENYGGVGLCFSFISDFIGLEVGSVMGLAAYGNKERFQNIDFFEYSGTDVMMSKTLLGIVNDYKSSSDRDFFAHFKNREDYRRNFDTLFGITKNDYTKRYRDTPNTTFTDIAARLQEETEKAMVFLANCTYEKTKSKNLCLAGGVALNINANTRILKETPFENIFVQPAATDDGLSLGAAYYYYHQNYPNKPRIPMLNASLGKTYGEKEILATLLKYKNVLHYHYDDTSYLHAAKRITDGKVVAWFYAGSEFGPRALGNRSLFADASSSQIKEKLSIIKRRQIWRPFAPLLLEEDLDTFFIDAIPNYFMTLIGKIRHEKKDIISAAVHADGTARYQTINEAQNEKTYKLLQEIKSIKGNSVILNTSYNASREPIVENPEDAIKMFLSTAIDLLILENFIVTKDAIYDEYAFDFEANLATIDYL